MEDIRTFLQALLYKNNINRLITDSRIENLGRGQAAGPDSGFIDIIAVKLTVNGNSDPSQETMLEVNYQQGSTFNVVVPKENQVVLDYLEIGKEINSLELYSSSIIFTDRCRVDEKSEVESGARIGDFSVSLTILESDDR